MNWNLSPPLELLLAVEACAFLGGATVLIPKYCIWEFCNFFYSYFWFLFIMTLSVLVLGL